MVIQEILQRRGETWRWGAQWLAIRSWQWPIKQSSKLIPLQPQEELPKNSALAILPSFGIWSKLERWKSSISGCLMSWQKIIILKYHLLLFYTTTTNHFLIELWHVMKSGFYMTISSVHLSGRTEKKLQNTFQSQTLTKKKKKKRSQSLFGGLLPVWSTIAFWIPAKAFHLRSMLSRSMKCTRNCSAYSQY